MRYASRLGIVCAIVGLVILSGCSAIKQAIHPAPTQSMPQTMTESCGKPANGKYVGLSVAKNNLIAPTEQAMGTTANVITLYYAIGATVYPQSLTDLCEDHKLPILDLGSDTESLAQIANGAEDGYFKNLASMVGSLQIPVGIDFDHEFNGSWYKWGYTHAQPSEFIAAWRHVVNLFRSNGATNVIWVWNPNVTMARTTNDLQAWYPGDSYVNWVGLDGYFYGATESYASVFDYTIDQIKKFTRRPFIIVETGASPASGQARAITSLFQGVAKTPGMLGFIYFDYDKTPTHNWYINKDPSALAAFKAGADAYLNGSG
jgi:mannan endo-1,4-beta-mannosidase